MLPKCNGRRQYAAFFQQLRKRKAKEFTFSKIILSSFGKNLTYVSGVSNSPQQFAFRLPNYRCEQQATASC
jgi:hypothetical protein